MAKELDVGALTLGTSWPNWPAPAAIRARTFPPPVFKQGVLKLEDLAAGMELTGTVLNVVDFGCFVDIGMHDSGLVHVSHLADRFIRDPHELVAVGDIVKVWVLAVDKERRRVSLTMVRPGSERPRRPPPANHRQSGPPATAESDRRRPPAARLPAGQTAGRRAQAQTGEPVASAAGSQGPPRPPGAGRTDQQHFRRPQRHGPPSSKPRPQSRDQGRPPQPRPRPRPFVPITDEMKTGKAPMRTFGDLLQFFEHKQPEAAAASSGGGGVCQ